MFVPLQHGSIGSEYIDVIFLSMNLTELPLYLQDGKPSKLVINLERPAKRRMELEPKKAERKIYEIPTIEPLTPENKRILFERVCSSTLVVVLFVAFKVCGHTFWASRYIVSSLDSIINVLRTIRFDCWATWSINLQNTRIARG